MCLGKRTYKSLTEAQVGADETTERENRIMFGGSRDIMQAYLCRFGNHYHFGHSSETRDPENIEREK